VVLAAGGIPIKHRCRRLYAGRMAESVCGNLRYAADTEPIFTAVCHCKTCQNRGGAATGGVFAGFAKDLYEDGR